MRIIKITAVCDQAGCEPAAMEMNAVGLMHWKCVECGFELHAGANYGAVWSDDGVHVFGLKAGDEHG